MTIHGPDAHAHLDAPAYEAPADIAWIDGSEYGYDGDLYLTQLPDGNTVLLRGSSRLIWLAAIKTSDPLTEVAAAAGLPTSEIAGEVSSFLAELTSKGLIAREGTDITLFAHGEMVVQALRAANAVADEGISVRVVDMFTLKPIDVDLIKQCADQTKRFVVLEDHLKMSGLAQGIANVLADEMIHLDWFHRLGIPQVYAGFGEDEDLRNKHGYGLQHTIDALRAAAEGKHS